MEQTQQTQQTQQPQTEKQKTWLEIEKENLESTRFSGEILPGLKLEQGKITTFEVDFSKEFGRWTDGKVIKKIIPVTHKGEKKNLWLNVKNPLYGQLINGGIKGQKVFKVSTTGTKDETRYVLVEEE
ncbi:MAG: hypothetical protein ACOC56_02295 [Atribacterota bacterium]